MRYGRKQSKTDRQKGTERKRDKERNRVWAD